MSSASSSEAFAIADYGRSVSIESTKRGLVFLIFGVLVSAVPIIRPVGMLIALAGATWYVLGRDPFGEKHSKYAMTAAAVFVVGLAFVLVGSIGYLLFVFSISGPSFPTYWWGNNAFAWALVPSLVSILAIEATGAIVTGLAYAIFTYSLQRSVARAILLVAFATNVAMTVLVFSVLSSYVSPQLLSAYYPGNFDPGVAHAFENQVLIVSLLNLIPAVIYVTAYYSVYSRLNRGQLIPLRL